MSSRCRLARTRCVLLAAAGLGVAAFLAAAGAVQTEDGQVATSFDGTPVVYRLHLPDAASASDPVHAVLVTLGWGGSRQRTPSAFSNRLLDNGYAVLSWDQRGFGSPAATWRWTTPTGGQGRLGSDRRARRRSAHRTQRPRRPRRSA